MRVTISDIARRAGVSTATVSRVLNEKPDVDPATAQRIREIVKELAYVPSASATMLRKGRAYCLGMLVPSLTWHWMLEVLRGVSEETEATGYNLMLYTMTRGEETMHNLLRQMSAKAIDGLIVVDPGEYIAQLQKSGLPIVLIDHLGDYADVPSVVATNFVGAYDATRHLLQLGRERVTIITGGMAYGCSRERLAGYKKALEDAGVPFDPALMYEGDFTESRSAAAGAAAVEHFLQHTPNFNAIFASNDLMALGAMQALQQAGRRVPEEVAVVGFDDLPLMEHIQPSLTTVHQPVYQLGITAVRMVQSALEGTVLASTAVEVPTTLVVRDSCGASLSGNKQELL
jgi:LacI family transcriptional regulator